MIKEFVNYSEALALRELGFSEPCFAMWTTGLSEFESSNVSPPRIFSSKFKLNDTQSCTSYINNLKHFGVSAPTFSQAFRFFREKYNLDGSLSVDVWNTKKVSWRITGGIEGKIFVNNEKELYDWESDEFDTYEEAETDCLKKLIEIAQKQKHLV